jgi:glucose-6-phosphate 1-dehydrogenase
MSDRTPPSETRNQKINPTVVVIFGASGDLTRRKLIPAFFSLYCEGRLSENFAVVGVARSEFGDEAFRQRLMSGVQQHSRRKLQKDAQWQNYASRLYYHQGNYDDPETYRSLAQHLKQVDDQHDTQGDYLFYLATPPGLYTTIVENLGAAGLAQSQGQGWRRIIIEKPFGHDLASAHDLNERVHQVFDEAQVYRIDHYLGKETVQNLLVFRFGNAIFEPLWNRNYIDHVQITVSETVGLEDRAGYYDGTGVMRDMFQNHLLQLLSLVALEPPVAFEATSLRDEKAKVLRAIRLMSQAEIAQATVRAQYRTYRDEPGVVKHSQTPTYAAVRFFIDNWRWRNVPFYLRSGKNLAAQTSDVTIQFKQIPHLMFAGQGLKDKSLPPNLLSLRIQPDEGVHLRFQTKVPGAGMRTRSVDMDFNYKQDFGDDTLPDAYERLLLDAIQGEAALFARSDEIETAWRIVDPIIQAWTKTNNPPLFFYEAGEWGPVEAEQLMAKDNRRWHLRSGDTQWG